MKSTLFFVLPLFVLLLTCSRNTSTIQGKVADGKGRPVAGLTVVAKQVSPPGQQIKVTTDTKGTFRFKRLPPAQQYVILPVSDKWKTSAKVTAKSGSSAQNYELPSPLTVRFTLSNDGVITDSRSGLQWVPASGSAMTWSDAARYAETLAVAGGGWRLPTRSELRDIYDESYEGHADPLFLIDRSWVWTPEISATEEAWFFSFENKYEGTHPREWLLTRGRVLAVRAAK